MEESDKLAARIIGDAEAEAKRIIAEAEAKKERDLSEAEKRAARQIAEATGEAERRAEAVRENARSSAARAVRNTCLAKKREEVGRVVNAALKRLRDLPDGEYFSLLERVAKNVATGAKGVMILNPEDLTRMPERFRDAVAALNLIVVPDGAEIPGGGFILRYGKIEINESFSALADGKKERLEDGVCPVLFG